MERWADKGFRNGTSFLFESLDLLFVLCAVIFTDTKIKYQQAKSNYIKNTVPLRNTPL